MASLLSQEAWSIISVVCAHIATICVICADAYHWSKCKLCICAAIITAIISIISFINIFYAPDLDNFRQNVHVDMSIEQRYELLSKENM